MDKAKRTLATQKYVQRNWELQFLGDENENHLQHYLFHNEKMNAIIPKKLTADFYQKFTNENAIYYSHSVSMLLTLSLFFSSEN